LIASQQGWTEEKELEDIEHAIVLDMIAKESYWPSGKIKSKSTPENYRSAIMWHYQSRLHYEFSNIPRPYRIDLNDFVKGHGNNVASAKDSGEYNGNARDHIEFNAFTAFSMILLQTGKLESLGIWNLSWFLQNRGELSIRSRYHNWVWRQDHINYQVFKTKDNPQGPDIVEGLVSIYCNPNIPELCMFFFLALYSCFDHPGFISEDNPLMFDDKAASQTYAKDLTDIVSKSSR
jgi:hypothetical protein